MYKISSSERTNEKATEYETKSMLYLLNYYNNRDEIELFAIDFFNDVTGIDSLAKKCFDVQSKGVKNIQPAMLGDYLVTLYKNFLSELNFVDFILFIQSVSPTLKTIIGVKSSFSFKDLNDEQRLSVKKSLISAAKKSGDIDLSRITDESAEDFLGKVQFVVDNKTCEEYIKDLIKLDSSIELNNSELKKIFKEIRDKQSSKKNNCVEGEIIENIKCIYNYDKYIKAHDIRMMILSRLISKDLTKIDKKITPSFIPLYSSVDSTIQADFLEDCCNDLYKMLSDKNNVDAYWILFSEIIKCIKNYPKYSVDDIYEVISVDILKNVHFLNINSARYFIALIKDGLTI